MNAPYHTALHAPEADGPAVQRWEKHGNQAFVHDINLGLPIEFNAVDVIYSELPWKDGYLEFLSRAGRSSGLALPYEKWLYRLSATLTAARLPFVLVGGKAMARCMASEWQMPLDLNGSLSMAIGAGMPKLEPAANAGIVIERLAARYRKLGDFCAGYGRTGRIACQYGRRFVLSDINPRCIGRIVEEYDRWMGF